MIPAAAASLQLETLRMCPQAISTALCGVDVLYCTALGVLVLLVICLHPS